VTGRIRSREKSSDLIRNQTHDLPACSIVPQPTTVHVPHTVYVSITNPRKMFENGGISPNYFECMQYKCIHDIWKSNLFSNETHDTHSESMQGCGSVHMLSG
jgi:hypothetical protein